MNEERARAAERYLETAIEEALGGLSAPDLSARATPPVERAGATSTSWRAWSTAALVLIGLGVVAGVALFGDGGAGEVAAPQDPEVVRPRDVDELRALVANTVSVDVAVRFVGSRSIEVDPDGPGGTTRFASPENVAEVVEAFGRELRPLPPAGWIWPNTIRMHLRDGRVVEMSLGRVGAPVLGVQGIQGDLRPSTSLQHLLGAHVELAEATARSAQGVVIGGVELARSDSLEGITFAPDLRSIRAFDLVPADMAHFARFTKLETLDLSGSARTLGSGWGEPLAPLPELRAITMRNARMDDADLRALSRHAELERLELEYAGASLTGAGFAAFHDAGRLRDVDLSRAAGLTDGGLVALFAVPSLRRLDLSGCPLRDVTVDGALAAVRSNVSLRELDLGDCPNIIVAMLYDLPFSLERLSLAGTDVGWDELGQLPPLASLDLSHCVRVDRAALERVVTRLGGFLEELDLGRCTALEPDDPGVLSAARRLRVLGLGGVRVSDDAVRAIATLPALEELDLSFADVGDAGAVVLAKSPAPLARLALTGCDKITDDGLRALARLDGLRALDLNVCDGFTQAGVDALRVALPGCELRLPDRFRNR